MENDGGTPLLVNARARLTALERRVAFDLENTGHPPVPWVTPETAPDGTPIYDVVIQGGGMQGIAIAYSLQRQMVGNILVVDENAAGFEGPWLSYARMDFLRTPKLFIGPDLGMPSLSFRDWFIARSGETAWNGITDIPKTDWVAYLRWFRRILRIPVLNGTVVRSIEPGNGDAHEPFRVTVMGPEDRQWILARIVVRAAGMLGAGGPKVPGHLTRTIPPGRYNHSSDAIDFGSLRGLRVGVIGAGASAYDNAALALEHGARSVLMFRRRKQPSLKFENLLSTLEWMKHYSDLSDAERWRLHRHLSEFSAPPPAYAVRRVASFDRFSLRAGRAVDSISTTECGTLSVSCGSEEFFVDHVIFATGFDVDLANVAELSPLAEYIALWRDRGQMSADERSSGQAKYPYLGTNFEYLERRSGDMPCLRRLYEFGLAATLSHGMTCVGLNSLNYGVQRLVNGITRTLFLAELPGRLDRLLAINPSTPPTEEEAETVSGMK